MPLAAHTRPRPPRPERPLDEREAQERYVSRFGGEAEADPLLEPDFSGWATKLLGPLMALGLAGTLHKLTPRWQRILKARGFEGGPTTRGSYWMRQEGEGVPSSVVSTHPSEGKQYWTYDYPNPEGGIGELMDEKLSSLEDLMLSRRRGPLRADEPNYVMSRRQGMSEDIEGRERAANRLLERKSTLPAGFRGKKPSTRVSVTESTPSPASRGVEEALANMDNPELKDIDVVSRFLGFQPTSGKTKNLRSLVEPGSGDGIDIRPDGSWFAVLNGLPRSGKDLASLLRTLTE